jgi:hypothetical protein
MRKYLFFHLILNVTRIQSTNLTLWTNTFNCKFLLFAWNYLFGEILPQFLLNFAKYESNFSSEVSSRIHPTLYVEHTVVAVADKIGIFVVFQSRSHKRAAVRTLVSIFRRAWGRKSRDSVHIPNCSVEEPHHLIKNFEADPAPVPALNLL